MFSSQPAPQGLPYGPVAVIESPKKPDVLPASGAEKIEEAEFSEEPSDVTSTDPVADEPEVIAAPTPAPEPERVIREAPPPAYQPTARRGLTPLERDLLDRLARPNGSRSNNPVGSIKSVIPTTARPDDE